MQPLWRVCSTDVSLFLFLGMGVAVGSERVATGSLSMDRGVRDQQNLPPKETPARRKQRNSFFACLKRESFRWQQGSRARGDSHQGQRFVLCPVDGDEDKISDVEGICSSSSHRARKRRPVASPSFSNFMHGIPRSDPPGTPRTTMYRQHTAGRFHRSHCTKATAPRPQRPLQHCSNKCAGCRQLSQALH